MQKKSKQNTSKLQLRNVHLLSILYVNLSMNVTNELLHILEQIALEILLFA